MAAQGARLACRIIVVRAPVAKGGGTCIMIRTPDQRVRVFVSSTLEELAAARAGGDPAEFDLGLADGQSWDIDSAVTAGLADP